MSNLMVLSLARSACCPGQGAVYVCNGFPLQIFASGKSSFPKSGSIETLKSVRVGNEPSLHRLYHQMVFMLAERAHFPAVMQSEMLSRGADDCTLRIDQESNDVGPAGLERQPSFLKCLLTTTATYKFPATAVSSTWLLQFVEKAVH